MHGLDATGDEPHHRQPAGHGAAERPRIDGARKPKPGSGATNSQETVV
eukprot:CAMPEP_0201240990 /NCGR_PEP_ID=MMETSP0852-20130820/31948_1 /ASSEMBLY_ACC=CAM_ASM_000632 /TAXON_ID=183588 /ORGANISM="Pseudo-nitzschia fraudulenta, Strain WWA7" /LENGTH=47 /DNA_ID= /DNA_START= /DNA_END= /DNA_ORIENTATION=